MAYTVEYSVQAIKNLEKLTRRPTHPGHIIKAHYLEPLELTITVLAKKLGVSRKTLSSVVNGHSPVTVGMAMRLSRAFSTTPDLWLNMQQNLDIWKAQQDNKTWLNVHPLFFKEGQMTELA